jgi:hypothetical protein
MYLLLVFINYRENILPKKGIVNIRDLMNLISWLEYMMIFEAGNVFIVCVQPEEKNILLEKM